MSKRTFLIFILLLTMMFFLIIPVSAQKIDVDSMDNEQLTTLLLQILNKLQAEEDPITGGDSEAVMTESNTPAATAIPAAEEKTIEKVLQITIYDNKKLMIEALPGYMFIQPSKPEDKTSEPDKTPEHYFNEPDIDEHGIVCHWVFVEGKWLCMYG